MTKKMWSRPTWFFFHGFAEKINENFYNNNYVLCWKYIIQNICENLPCPICKRHATEYVRFIKHSDINTKEKLKLYLFKFHNDVNKSLSKPIYSYQDLHKYKQILIRRTFNVMYKKITMDYYGGKSFSGWTRKKNMQKTLNFMTKINNYL
jgi:hypothetical protein